MLDVKRALSLTKPQEIKRAAEEAETRRCEGWIVRRLWNNYFAACEKEAKEDVKQAKCFTGECKDYEPINQGAAKNKEAKKDAR